MLGVEHRDAVTVLRMEHGKANALDLELLDGLSSALDMAARSDAVAVVLTGRGSIFSAGVDLFRLLDGGEAYIARFLPLLGSALEQLLRSPLPVVAAVNGHAIAGGCVVACACDRRVMNRDAGKVGVPELRVGVPFPAAALELVRAAVPRRYLQEVITLGRTYDAEAALERGLVDELQPADEVEERAVAVAVELASVGRETFALTKQQLRAPLLASIERTAGAFGGEVRRRWLDPESHATIRAYLDATLGKGG